MLVKARTKSLVIASPGVQGNKTMKLSSVALPAKAWETIFARVDLWQRERPQSKLPPVSVRHGSHEFRISKSEDDAGVAVYVYVDEAEKRAAELEIRNLKNDLANASFRIPANVEEGTPEHAVMVEARDKANAEYEKVEKALAKAEKRLAAIGKDFSFVLPFELFGKGCFKVSAASDTVYPEGAELLDVDIVSTEHGDVALTCDTAGWWTADAGGVTVTADTRDGAIEAIIQKLQAGEEEEAEEPKKDEPAKVVEPETK